jgi:hypothetical protein
VPADYPNTASLNKRLSKIDASEINIHTSGGAGFRGDPDAPLTNIEPRKFIEEFLEFYSREVLDSKQTFDYEDFYDYYKGLETGSECAVKLALFFDDFRKRHNIEVNMRFSDQADRRHGASRSPSRTKPITLSEQADHPGRGHGIGQLA